MLAAHLLECAIDVATQATIDGVRSNVWKALANDQITDEDAQRLSDKIDALYRKPKASADKPSFKRPSIFKPRKIQKPRDPKESVKRRRENSRYAMSPKMSAQFTNGELSVFLIVAEECQSNGHCDRSIAEIAARAGVCRALAQRALRLAMGMGLLLIRERPVRGQKNKTNVITIVSKEWLEWTNRRFPSRIGSKSVAPTDKPNNNKGFRPTFEPFGTTRERYSPIKHVVERNQRRIGGVAGLK